MRKLLLIGWACWFSYTLVAQPWQPAGNKIRTPWAEQVNPSSVLPEYPRPSLQRPEWLNLNGLWDFAVLPKGKALPDQWQGKILVPFAIESSLSGVMKPVLPHEELWYHRSVTIPPSWKGKRLLLHFGAVDWKADVFINGLHLGGHQGGYAPFSVEITDFAQPGKSFDLVVRVWDPTDQGFQPRGKQVLRPHGIWYTAVTGIWQTVWLEPVPQSFVQQFRVIPDVDASTLKVTAIVDSAPASARIKVQVKKGHETVAEGWGLNGREILIPLAAPILWSPENPFLYDVDAQLLVGNQVVDQVKGYCALRKVSLKKDENGWMRIQLNNRNYFMLGTLDQGWWPDGLYTAPTDEALRYDIVQTKALGFNTIRKHVKVEPERWYYHCDREGILVWQDMPSGDEGPEWQPGIYFNGREAVREPASEENFRREWKEIIDLLYNHPCVVTWIPFNESWGQFKTPEIVGWTKDYDPTRLVDPASGGNHYPVGDILDVHHYPDPELILMDGSRANVLGEFGGIGLALEGHLWEPNRNWGYVQYKTQEEATVTYTAYADKLKRLIRSGYSAAIYTQTTDVETEVNGLMTYDRKVVKLTESLVRKANLELISSLAP